MKKEKIIKPLDQVVEDVNSEVDDKISLEELIDLITKIASMHRNKNFAYFTEEDIEGEVWKIALEQIGSYDPSKGIGSSTINSVERWLNRVVKNRLRNFYRDKYSSVNETHRANRMNLINTLGLDEINITDEKNAKQNFPDPSNSLVFEELMDFVEGRLSEETQSIFYDCLNGEHVASYYKTKLSHDINMIFDEWRKINKEDENGKAN